MGYIPSNPNYAVVNCKIGDMNITPIPPNSLESFTFERDTVSSGNKFSIVVHDETAIIMESYLAEAAGRARNNESYDYDGFDIQDMSTVDEGTMDEVNKNIDDLIDKMTGGKEQTEENRALMRTALLRSHGINPIAEIPQSSASHATYVTTEEDRNHKKVQLVSDNDSPFSGLSLDETNTIGGGTGRVTTDIDTPNRTVTMTEDVERNVIDNSKLRYADPATGIHEIYGVTIPEGVWMDPVAALMEHSGGRGDS